MTEIDAPAFEMLCRHYGMVVEAAKILKADGLVVQDKDENGVVLSVRKHPAEIILRMNSTAFRHYAEQFGLTPSARVRLAVDIAEDEPSLAEALFSLVERGGS